MKKYLLIFSYFFFINYNISFGQNEICETCVEYSLEIFYDKLEGSSLQFSGYDVSMKLPPDFLCNELSIKKLISIIDSQDIRGEFIFPNGRTTEIKYSIIPYHDSTTIFMKTSNGWFPWDKMRIENNKLIFSYDYWYCPPASKTDLEILDLCLVYLKDSNNWHQNDDRACENDKDDKILSLFCALKIASIEIMKEYNHRNAAIQTVRFIIDHLIPNHGYVHTLKDYNNSPSTTHKDILKVLGLAKERIKKELLENE
jgi:hypothetical protein